MSKSLVIVLELYRNVFTILGCAHVGWIQMNAKYIRFKCVDFVNIYIKHHRFCVANLSYTVYVKVMKIYVNVYQHLKLCTCTANLIRSFSDILIVHVASRTLLGQIRLGHCTVNPNLVPIVIFCKRQVVIIEWSLLFTDKRLSYCMFYYYILLFFL